MATEFRAVGRCKCPSYSGSFAYRPEHNAWIFEKADDVPPRSMSSRTVCAVYIERRDLMHPDHSGDRYFYQVCPWCGGDLDGIRYDGGIPGPFGGSPSPQGDGGED